MLTVTRLDRLARSTRDLLNTLAAITGKGAGAGGIARALLLTLEEFLAEDLTPEIRHAWLTVYGTIALTMVEAAED